MNANPYDSPKHEARPAVKPVSGRKRWIAFYLIGAPFVLTAPLRYWALHHAGGWFVSTDLDPEHRRALLGLMCFGLLLSISIWCFLAASILLWLDRFFPFVSALAAFVFGVLAIPAGIFIAICIRSYIEFG